MNLSCSICLQRMTDDSHIACLPVCGHVFDLDCIEQCLKIKPRCPICNLSADVYSLGLIFPTTVDEAVDDNSALKDAKAKLDAATVELDAIQKRYSQLDMKLQVAKDDLSKAKYDKARAEDSANAVLAGYNAQNDTIQNLTVKLLAMEFQLAEEGESMQMKLDAKQNYSDALTKYLDLSDREIRALKNELDTQQGSGIGLKYNRLKDQHLTLNNKMQKLEKRFIDFTLACVEDVFETHIEAKAKGA